MAPSPRSTQLAEIVHLLPQLLPGGDLPDDDGLSMWSAIHHGCALAADATTSELYLYDPARRRLELVERWQAGYQEAPLVPVSVGMDEEHIAARAARRGLVLQDPPEDAGEGVDASGGRALAVPLRGAPGPSRSLLGVVVLGFQGVPPDDWGRIRAFLSGHFLEQVWPIATFASIRYHFPRIGVDRLHSQRLDEVYRQTLDTLCNELGFTFATISVVAKEANQIRTVACKSTDKRKVNPRSWMQQARHPISSEVKGESPEAQGGTAGQPLDIQADVLRTGKVELIYGWDDRLDRAIYDTFHHENLLRAFVPLGGRNGIGTIEAGFVREDGREEIDPLLIAVLVRYAEHVTVAIRNAQNHERLEQYAALQAQLHKLWAAPWDGDARDPSERDLLQQLVDTALPILSGEGSGDADSRAIVLVYPRERRMRGDSDTLDFAEPIVAGKLKGHRDIKRPEPDSVVHRIARTKPIYLADVERDPELFNMQTGIWPTQRSFTSRQRIHSFAGVPMVWRGRVVGVLCVNYRKPRQFDRYERRLIGLVAQQGAALMTAAELVREQERTRLERDLHDQVKSKLSGLILHCRALSARDLQRHPQRAWDYLDYLRQTAEEILADVKGIMDTVVPMSPGGDPLRERLLIALKRLRGPGSAHVTVHLDDHLPDYPDTVKHNLVCLMDQAVTNALQHAQARSIRVVVHYRDGQFSLSVEDDGKGFVLPDDLDEHAHCGLSSMRDRARRIGGILQIGPREDGSGTRVCVTIADREANREARNGG